MSTPGGNSRRVSAALRRTAHTRLVPVKKFLASSRMWRLWRGRNLERRAMGPLEGPNEWSIIAAPRADESGPSAEIVGFALRAVERAQAAELKLLRERRPGDAERIDRLSGHHYRILAGLAEAWGARRIVEVGTYRGTSALALLGAPTVEQLVTYDLVGWEQFAGTWLRPADFGERLEQRLVDLSEPKVFADESDVLARADMIFIDASKDGVFEPALLAELFGLEPLGPQLIVLDDIRVLTMIRVWRAIRHDKLDLTSFGHWSGTGIVVRGGFPPEASGS